MEQYTTYRLDIIPISKNANVKNSIVQNSIGSIEYNFEVDNGLKIVKVIDLRVNPKSQSQGLGSKLLLLMFADLLQSGKQIDQITLDDCSDYALTKGFNS